VAAGRATDEQRNIMIGLGEKLWLWRSQKAEAVALDRTDLFLAFDGD
jgi:hypothetical protein